MRLVKATKLGFDGKSRRYPGDVFEIPDHMALGSWMVLVEQEQESVQEPEKKKRGRPRRSSLPS